MSLKWAEGLTRAAPLSHTHRYTSERPRRARRPMLPSFSHGSVRLRPMTSSARTSTALSNARTERRRPRISFVAPPPASSSSASKVADLWLFLMASRRTSTLRLSHCRRSLPSSGPCAMTPNAGSRSSKARPVSRARASLPPTSGRPSLRRRRLSVSQRR
jgi:hypothetical protein